MLIGYARVSTADQRMDLQRNALIAAGVDPENLYEENASGAKDDRKQLELALKAPWRPATFWWSGASTAWPGRCPA